MKSNKETLEEAAEKYASKIWDYSNSNEKILHINCKKAFSKGAKWEAKRKYSEEEVKKLIINFLFERGIGREVENVKEWFEQFKKK